MSAPTDPLNSPRPLPTRQFDETRANGPFFLWKTVKKIKTLALIFFVVSAPLTVLFPPLKERACWGRSSCQKPPHPVTEFPDCLQYFPHTVGMTPDGHHTCMPNPNLPPPAQADCQSAVEQVQSLGRNKEINTPALLKYRNHVGPGTGSSEFYWFKNWDFDLKPGIAAIYYGQQPREWGNHKDALHFAEEHFLKAGALGRMSNEEIEVSIQKMNTIYLEGITDGGRLLTGGAYRTKQTFLLYRGDLEKFDWMGTARKRGASRQDPAYQSFERKLSSDQFTNPEDNLEALFKSFTGKERVFFNKYFGYLFTHHSQVPPEMKKLVSRIRELASLVEGGKMDPIDAAAEVHTKMIGIHPFIDGNGRVARLLMNIFLQLGGRRAIAFPSRKAYNEATSDELNGNRGTFVALIQRAIPYSEKLFDNCD